MTDPTNMGSHLKIMVSIISHGNQKEIMDSGLIEALGNLPIVVRENMSDCERLIPPHVSFNQNLHRCGFGENHNKNFESAALSGKDWFVICNPDIYITEIDIRRLIDVALRSDSKIIAPRLWDDRRNLEDNNVRPFIKIVPLVLSFLGFPRLSRYSQEQLRSLDFVDWASGALLAIRADTFSSVRGFDERFFMYVEDVDLCWRLRLKGFGVRYCRDIVGLHRAARNNQKSLKSFSWHVRSLLRYFLSI